MLNNGGAQAAWDRRCGGPSRSLYCPRRIAPHWRFELAESRRCALVTGASVGIGRELARQLAGLGYDLILVSRSHAALEKVATECRETWDVRADVVVEDLSRTDAAAHLFNTIEEAGWHVDVLVNNAGIGNYGYFCELDECASVNETRLNVVALTQLTRLFVPKMKERGWGRVLNLSSVGGFVSGPLLAVYYATKAYVLHFSEALGEEVKGTGVTVTALCPGPTHTEFHKRGKMLDSRFMKTLRFMSAGAVAEKGISGLMRGKALVIPGWRNKISILLIKWAPRALVKKVLFVMQKKRGAA